MTTKAEQVAALGVDDCVIRNGLSVASVTADGNCQIKMSLKCVPSEALALRDWLTANFETSVS